MAFQFLCPHGHLLAGDPAHMGMQCQCPQCGVVFIIPTIQLNPQPAQPEPAATDPYADVVTSRDLPFEMGEFSAAESAPFQAAVPNFSEPDTPAVAAPEQFVEHEVYTPAESPAEFAAAPQLAPHEAPAVGSELSAPGEGAPRVVHIPCPNGHVLDTPLDMIGEEVLCPHCGAQFRLRNEDSREYQAAMEKIIERRSQVAFTWAIVAAVVFVLGLIIMAGVLMRN